MADAYGGTSERLRVSEQLTDREEEAAQKLEFLELLVQAFHDEMHTDVDLIANDGHTLKSHRIVMATKSPVFRAMFEADRIKGPHTEAVKFPDLNHEQLKCLFEFLYCAHIPDEKLARHSHALFIAAHKYDIKILRNVCEAYISSTVSPAYFVEILEMATVCSATTLIDTAVRVILPRFDEVVFSKEYEDFSVKNAHLALEITKAFVSCLRPYPHLPSLYESG